MKSLVDSCARKTSIVCDAGEGCVSLYRLDPPERYDPEEKLRALAHIVARLCRQLNLPLPALTYDEDDEINAGVTGTGPHDAVLYFSGGALSKLAGHEAAAVAAHELAHIAARDFNDNGADLFAPGSARLAPLCWVAGVVRLIAWTIAKRRQEYAADGLAAALVGEEPLIAALRRTAQDKRRPIRWLFATHPHPRRRIRALERRRRTRSQRCLPPRNQLVLKTFTRQI